MNQNAQTVPPSVLQQIIQEHLHNRKQEPFYDKDWKLTWSRKESTTLFTYFLYDEQNRPIEIGEVILSCAGPYQLTTLRRQTRQQVIDFILSHQCRTNVLRTIYKEDAPATAIQQPAATAESTLTLQTRNTKQHCFADDLLQSIFGTQSSTRQQPYSPSYPQPLLPYVHQLLWHRDYPNNKILLSDFISGNPNSNTLLTPAPCTTVFTSPPGNTTPVSSMAITGMPSYEVVKEWLRLYIAALL